MDQGTARGFRSLLLLALYVLIAWQSQAIASSSHNVLTPQQKTFFQDNGFLVVENFAASGVCEALKKRASELVSTCNFLELALIHAGQRKPFSWENYYLRKGEKLCFFFEEQAFQFSHPEQLDKARHIKKISYVLHESDPFFKEFSYQPKIMQILNELGWEDPRLLQSMYLFKQPHIGSAVACHQDSTFIHTQPESLIGFWFALEEATIENGCLWVLPGAHLTGLKYKMFKTEEGEIIYDIYDETPWPLAEMIPLEVAKGSLVVMHGHLPHLSRENRSEQSRQAYALHIIDGKSAYLPSNWLSLKSAEGHLP